MSLARKMDTSFQSTIHDYPNLFSEILIFSVLRREMSLMSTAPEYVMEEKVESANDMCLPMILSSP
jgi:hypothetical protein